MPNDTDRKTPSTIIRWTDDEWRAIVDHLCANRGRDPMRVLDLEKIKAKDVFVAQEVLPEDRHRKLVSIAQGFAGIRARLDALAQTLPLRNVASACAEKTEIHLGPEAASKTAAAASPTSVQEKNTCDWTTPSDQLTAEQLSARTVVTEKQGSPSVRQASSRTNRPQKRSPIPGLLVTMRPFIVMVCEEFAKALARVVSTPAMNVTLPGAFGQVRYHVVASRAEARHGAFVDEMQLNLDSNETNHEHYLANETNVERVDLESAPQEEGEEDRLDVQPLFDPKLPPSADSDFKPKIGLVGTPGCDFEGLRQHYPQLHLTIVQAETLSDVRRFGHCQRVIALREEISLGTDTLLSGLLRHRYIRLDGGMNDIKAQLDAWLASPGLIAAGPRRRVPFGGGKGNPASKIKRQSRYPDWAGDAG